MSGVGVTNVSCSPARDHGPVVSSGAGGVGAACTATFDSPVTVGHCVIAEAFQDSKNNGPILTNAATNSMDVVWGHQVYTSRNTSTTPQGEIYSGVAASAGKSVTLTAGTSGASVFLELLEVANISCNATDGLSAYYSGGSAVSSAAPGSITTTNAKTFILTGAAAASASRAIINPSSPWTNLTGTTSGPSVGTSYQITSSTGTFNPSFGIWPSDKVAAVMAAFPAGTPTAFNTHFDDKVKGTYCYNCFTGDTPDATALANSDVCAFRINVGWNEIETADGIYDWSPIDNKLNAVAAGGKKVSIAVNPGYQTPSWVYTAGADKLTYIWDTSWGPGYCASVDIPVPWNSIYLSKLAAFITALGNRYASNAWVARVYITGINSKTPELLLPHSAGGDPINGGQCYSNHDIQNWINKGYTRQKIKDTFDTLASDFQTAFPNIETDINVVGGGFPPLDDAGSEIPNETVDHDPSQYFLHRLQDPSLFGQAGAQNNGLSATNIYSGVMDFAYLYDTGYQTVGVLGYPDFGTAVQMALDAGARFLEFYPTDVDNPFNAAALHNAAVALGCQNSAVYPNDATFFMSTSPTFSAQGEVVPPSDPVLIQSKTCVGGP